MPAVGREVGSLEGAWEGKLRIVASNLSQDSDSYKRVVAGYEAASFKIIIQGEKAKVFLGDTEVKPGSFQAQIFMTNAVVFASSSGEDADGRWVETWSFVVTLKDPEVLDTSLSRMVNNLDIPTGKDFSKFFTVAVGELRRASR